VSWGRMQVEGLDVGKDFKLYPGGRRPWDWAETDTVMCPASSRPTRRSCLTTARPWWCEGLDQTLKPRPQLPLAKIRT
jgi:hypothetical protein